MQCLFLVEISLELLAYGGHKKGIGLCWRGTAMIFSRDDFKIDSYGEFFEFLLVLPFVGLIFPFLAAVYGLGFVMDKTGWLKT